MSTNAQNIDPFQALDFIRDNASEYGRLKAYATFMTEKRKTIKSALMQRSMERTESAKESWAYAHPEYIQHLEEMRDAIAEYETLRILIVAAEAKIEAWRSLEATARSEVRLTQ